MSVREHVKQFYGGLISFDLFLELVWNSSHSQVP